MAGLPGEGVSILWSGKPSGDGAEHFGWQAHFFPFCCSKPVAEGADFVSVSVKSLASSNIVSAVISATNLIASSDDRGPVSWIRV